MFRFIVEENVFQTDDVLRLTLRHSTADSKPFSYTAGQYAAIAYHYNGRPSSARCFSITSDPNESGLLQFGIRVSGKFTHRLSAIKPGEQIDVRGPYRAFVLEKTRNDNYIFAAGGIGIAPFISMLRGIAKTNPHQSVHLLYGLQSQKNIPFFHELATISKQLPKLSISFCVSHGDVDKLQSQTKHTVYQGRVDDAIIQIAIKDSPTTKTLFICGPPPFMQSVTS